jgi:enamine deaminase RidA (YjgF/YER057c/UK114 family)
MSDTINTATRAFSLINPVGLYDPSSNGYSHVASLHPGVRLVFIAGQGGENKKGELPEAFHAQVRQAFDNLLIALNAAGAAPRDVAKLTVLIVDHNEDKLHVLGEELERAFGAGLKPACTLIPVPRLALDGMFFEVDAVAALSQ